jgi:hypothetical protein
MTWIGRDSRGWPKYFAEDQLFVWVLLKSVEIALLKSCIFHEHRLNDGGGVDISHSSFFTLSG